MASKRVRSKQVWVKAENGGYSDWQPLATECHIDFCCDCGLAHEFQFAVFRRAKGRKPKLMPKNSVWVWRRLRLAPKRTAGVRRSKHLRPVAHAVARMVKLRDA